MEVITMSASIFGERLLALLGSSLISALLWAPIASPVEVAATVQAVGQSVTHTVSAPLHGH
jgi:hypothetical protein